MCGLAVTSWGNPGDGTGYCFHLLCQTGVVLNGHSLVSDFVLLSPQLIKRWNGSPLFFNNCIGAESRCRWKCGFGWGILPPSPSPPPAHTHTHTHTRARARACTRTRNRSVLDLSLGLGGSKLTTQSNFLHCEAMMAAASTWAIISL